MDKLEILAIIQDAAQLCVGDDTKPMQERIAALILRERAACAKLADDYVEKAGVDSGEEIAGLIRARETV